MEKKKVKKIEELTQLISSSGDEVLNEFITYQQLFNEAGKTILTAAWESNGILQNKSTYTYDDKGNRIAEEIFLDEENISEHWTYVYDEEGKLVKKAVEYADGSISSYQKNTEPENTYKWIATDEAGELEGREISKYNNKELLLINIEEDDEGFEMLRKEFDYDEKGNMIAQTIYENEEPSSKEMMQYDENNNLIQSVRLSPNGNKINETKYFYDQNNNLSHRDINEEIRVAYTYDAKGNQIEVKQSNLQTDLNSSLVQFKYDEEGQLIEKLVYEMGAEYNVEPGVVGRSTPIHQKVIMKYEYF